MLAKIVYLGKDTTAHTHLSHSEFPLPGREIQLAPTSPAKMQIDSCKAFHPSVSFCNFRSEILRFFLGK